MFDLPTLKFGCGKFLADWLVHGKVTKIYCGEGDKIKAYCEFCQRNFDAVKAHAAAHQKEVENLWKLSEENSKLTKEGKQYLRFFIRYRACNIEAARDAVLELAGLTVKDLEGDAK